MKKEFLTCVDMVNLFNDYQSVCHIIERAEDFKQSHPATPYKPRLKDNATSDEVREYAKLLEEYEKSYEEYKLEHLRVRDFNMEVENEIESFIKDISGLNDIPEKSRDKVWYKAYQDGHSSGIYSVYQELCELVELF